MTTKSEGEGKAPTPQRLYRSDNNKVIGGVCGGLGEYLDIDATIVRIIFIILTIFGGSGLLLYLILWIVIPSKKASLKASEYMKANLEEMKDRAKGLTASVRQKQSSNRIFLAGAIILIGLLLLFNNFGFYEIDFGKLWPVWLIIAGLLLLRRK